MNRIAIIYDDIFLEHETGGRPDNPERLKVLINSLKSSGIKSYLDWFKPVPADEDEIALIHSQEMIDYVKETISGGGGLLDPDTYVSPGSLDAALAAAGTGKVAVGLVFSKKYNYVFIPARPPGHHATSSRSMGGCIFNNQALCARIALDYKMVNKIAIIDFDVHHGNGIEEIFYSDNRIFYMSVHQSPLFPGTGLKQDTGHDKGKGFTLNVPLPSGVGNEEYINVFLNRFKPAVEEFQPDLFIISAGFDGHARDPMGNHMLDESGYETLGKIIKEMALNSPAEGKIIAFLEGGYDYRALPSSAISMLSSWLEIEQIQTKNGEETETE